MNETLTENVLLSGVEAGLEESRVLRAGPWTMELAGGQLRTMRIGGVEVVRRVYAAVRDGFWNTVPGMISGMEVEESDGGFTVRYRSAHRQFEADFVWEAEITGHADGTVRFGFDGVARRTFARNRIGLCVLHPDWLAGSACEVEHVSGEVAERAFPHLVDPMQPVRGLHDFRVIRHAAVEGVAVEVSCEGDVFEIEDQRNWTDASFKTYSTPQRIPLPGTIREGQRVRQAVTLRLLGNGLAGLAPATPAEVVAEVELREGVARQQRLPELGIGHAVTGPRMLSEVEAGLLRAAGMAWLRIDLDFESGNWREVLGDGLAQAGMCGASVEAALHLPEDPGTALAELVALGSVWSGRVARWLVLSRGKPATQVHALEAARRVLGGSAPVGGGTDSDFFQLNNNRPPAALLDFVSVPMRPLAHQFDELTMFENLAGQAAVMEALTAIYPGVPRYVSPVSLRTRAQKGPPMPAGQMPAQADVRQMSLIAAAWTLGCVGTLAEAGAAGVTLFQTLGLRGVMESSAGSAVPGVFHSFPGMVYPLWQVLAALNGGGQYVPLVADVAGVVRGFAVERDGGRRVFLANQTGRTQRIRLNGVRGGAGNFRVLDAAAVGMAVRDAEAFASSGPGVAVADGVLTLGAYATAWSV
ncbi:MAG: hypothetical protein RLZZ179_2570 [Verrucomicrobiota bacterium]|jgi:hypothetical protein